MIDNNFMTLQKSQKKKIEKGICGGLGSRLDDLKVDLKSQGSG